ncbi:MAG: FkbM family methyltransferase [Ginsengibacter sp.]
MNYDRSDYINEPVAIETELKGLFKTKNKLIFFDIGACEGEESIKYSRLFPNAVIYAFEPLPENINLIRNNFINYQVKNASFYNKAISSKNGFTDFYVSSGQPENAPNSDWDYGNKSSSLLQPDKHLEMASFIKFETKIKVETITLKLFCKENNISSIDFLHMDVQGAELMVLEGAQDFISSIKVIWLEVSKIEFYKQQPLVGDIKKFMKDHNFFLLKDALNSFQGDQLYISKLHYSSYAVLKIQMEIAFTLLMSRIKKLFG